MAEEEEIRQKGLRSYIAISEIVAEFSEFPAPTLQELSWFRKSIRALVKKGLVASPRIKEDAQLYLILTAKGHKWVAVRSEAIRRKLTPLGEAVRMQVGRLIGDKESISYRTVIKACEHISKGQGVSTLRALIRDGHLVKEDNAISMGKP
jgi:hypothetical protein